MNIVIKTLREFIENRGVRFVFPSEIAARLWAQKTCTLAIARSVSSRRFIAWDRFKEEAVRKRDASRKPVSHILRKLFTDALIRKNAEAVRSAHDARGARDTNIPRAEGFPLRSLIPPEYAGGGAVFAASIVRLLPSLRLWEKLTRRDAGRDNVTACDGVTKCDDEDLDLELIKTEYTAFLERHGLFEPSWEDMDIREESSRYVIFFPELIEDFAEYDALLKPPRFIRVEAERAVPPDAEKPALISYNSAKEEIRAAVMELQRLHDVENISYEEMAVSVPELEEMEPHVLKEFSIRHIPVTRRAGKKLGETGAGRFFSLVSECASSRFSFDALKALILNDHIPWKKREQNKALINFGIKYNCVSAYFQNGKPVDIWEEAFREAYNDGGRELAPYYAELKKHVSGFMSAENFAAIIKNYFAFRGVLLDMENIAEEDDAVLSRCVEELVSLSELEKEMNDPGLVPDSPFAFFLSCLNEKEYVRANQNPGVNIFRWRVAAAAPFSCHFVLNASQSAASVLYRPMKFLRQDKRKLLGLEDTDATGAFFTLCGIGDDEAFTSHTRISSSAQTFSGWAIPHSYFARGKIASAAPASSASGEPDPYAEERRFWRECNMPGGTSALRKIFPLQKQSFDFWKNALVLSENNFSFFASPVPAASPARELLSRALPERDGLLAVTPTGDLNVYYECAQKWLYKRIFRAGKYSLEAALLDDTSLGKLYHTILEKLFARIGEEDQAFNSRRLESYKRWTLEITRAAIKEDRAFKGPLAVPLVSPQAAGMAKKLAGLLDLEAKNFDGYRVAALEWSASLKTGNVIIEGIIDRVSLSPNGEPLIVDYKTGYSPKQTEPENLEEDGLMEFQMPLYITLYEESVRTDPRSDFNKVQEACFYSITEKKIKMVMGGKGTGKTKAQERGEYGAFLEAAEKQIEEFERKVKAFDFIPRRIRFTDCFNCVYKTACRTVYFQEGVNVP